jgi:hypothetical protein
MSDILTQIQDEVDFVRSITHLLSRTHTPDKLSY